MAEGQLFTVGLWTVKEGRADEFIDAWTSFARWTSEHCRGAIGAYLVRDVDMPQRFMTFRPWSSAEDIQSWKASPEFKDSFARIRSLSEEVRPLTAEAVAQVGREMVRAR